MTYTEQEIKEMQNYIIGVEQLIKDLFGLIKTCLETIKEMDDIEYTGDDREELVEILTEAQQKVKTFVKRKSDIKKILEFNAKK